MAAIGRSPYNGSDSGTLLPSLSAPLLCEFLQLSSDSNSLLSQLGKAHLLVWRSAKKSGRASKTTTDRWYSILSLSEEEELEISNSLRARSFSRTKAKPFSPPPLLYLILPSFLSFTLFGRPTKAPLILFTLRHRTSFICSIIFACHCVEIEANPHKRLSCRGFYTLKRLE